MAGKWDESKVKRDAGGRFSKTSGTSVSRFNAMQAEVNRRGRRAAQRDAAALNALTTEAVNRAQLSGGHSTMSIKVADPGSLRSYQNAVHRQATQIHNSSANPAMHNYMATRNNARGQSAIRGTQGSQNLANTRTASRSGARNIGNARTNLHVGRVSSSLNAQGHNTTRAASQSKRQLDSAKRRYERAARRFAKKHGL